MVLLDHLHRLQCMKVDRLQLLVVEDHSRFLLHFFVSQTGYHQSFAFSAHHDHHWHVFLSPVLEPTFHQQLKYRERRYRCTQPKYIQQKQNRSNIKPKLVLPHPQNFYANYLHLGFHFIDKMDVDLSGSISTIGPFCGHS